MRKKVRSCAKSTGIIPVVGRPLGKAFHREEVTSALSTPERSRKTETDFLNPDYHLGSYSLPYKKKGSLASWSFYQTQGFSQTLLAPKKINQPRKGSTNHPFAWEPSIKEHFIRFPIPPTQWAGRRPGSEPEGPQRRREQAEGGLKSLERQTKFFLFLLSFVHPVMNTMFTTIKMCDKAQGRKGQRRQRGEGRRLVFLLPIIPFC